MKRTYNTDPIGNEEQEMLDEIAHDKHMEDLSLREREEKAEELINEQLNNKEDESNTSWKPNNA